MSFTRRRPWMAGWPVRATAPVAAGNFSPKKGQSQRWHFAHYQGGGDEYCYETAAHKMAKQVLLAGHQVEIPTWKRIAGLFDLDQQLQQEILERPARRWESTRAREDVWMVGMRPDVVLEDDHPTTVPLLVEVKVSNAVGHEKAALVRKRGWAMIEIHLSKLNADAVLDNAFERAVLQEAPRFWIHSPTAERLFEQVQAKVEQQVADRNAQILAGHARRDAARRSSEAKLDADRRRKERFRQKLRAPLLGDLQALVELSSPSVARERLLQLSERDAPAIDVARGRYLEGALPSTGPACSAWRPISGTSPFTLSPRDVLRAALSSCKKASATAFLAARPPTFEVKP